MTVLQLQECADEGEKPPPSKKRCLTTQGVKKFDYNRTLHSWVTGDSLHNRLTTPKPDGMVSGYGYHDALHDSALISPSSHLNGLSENTSPISPLLNLGNTCFLNSILYTLRFAPGFLHKLHHLNEDATHVAKQLYCNKPMTYSLGRNSTKMSKTKDLQYSINSSDLKTQTVIEKLHQLYHSLYQNEQKERMEPLQPDIFLHALRDVNNMFEGNQQHDAHELLVCLLDIIRECCQVLYQQNSLLERNNNPPPAPTTASTTTKIINSLKKFKQFGKPTRPEKNTMRETHSDLHIDENIKRYLANSEVLREDNRDPVVDSSGTERPMAAMVGQNTIFDDFQGVSLLQTTCLECENMNERRETFCDICVPIKTSESPCIGEESMNELYHSVIVTEEYLADCNKYWCDTCNRYNEAKRCVRYRRLPRLLTLHLKRFSSNYGSQVAKVIEYMPTPLKLACFCEECFQVVPPNKPIHAYHLYGIVMHVGSTIASGHYVAYVRTSDNTNGYSNCVRDTNTRDNRDKGKTNSLSRSTAVHSFVNNGIGEKPFYQKILKMGPNSMKDSPERFENRSLCKAMECCNTRLRAHVSEGREILPEYGWLQCDDDCVTQLKTNELLHILSPQSCATSASTPYLLFYVRTPNE